MFGKLFVAFKRLDSFCGSQGYVWNGVVAVGVFHYQTVHLVGSQSSDYMEFFLFSFPCVERLETEFVCGMVVELIR